EAGILSDLGGEPSTAQRTLVQGARTCLGVCLLGNAYLRQGTLAHLKRNRWILATLATYLNSLKLYLQAIGLKRVPKDAFTLESVLSEYTERSNAGQDAATQTGAD